MVARGYLLPDEASRTMESGELAGVGEKPTGMRMDHGSLKPKVMMNEGGRMMTTWGLSGDPHNVRQQSKTPVLVWSLLLPSICFGATTSN